MAVHPSTLSKTERIWSKKLIDVLFNGGRSYSMAAFPLRLVYMPLGEAQEENGADTLSKLLISVPKRCFKHAVKRNRVKRQIREAYRRHKALIADHHVALAMIWLDGKLYDSRVVEAKVCNLLRRAAERLVQYELQASRQLAEAYADGMEEDHDTAGEDRL